MDGFGSFRAYGKVDPIDDKVYKRKSRRRLITIVIASVLLVLIVVGAVVGVVVSRKDTENSSNSHSPNSRLLQSIKEACSVTLYPDICFTSMSAAAANLPDGSSLGPVDLILLSLRVASDGIARIEPLPSQLLASLPKDADPRVRAAVEICSELLDSALDSLNDSLAVVEARDSSSTSSLPSRSEIEDLRTLLTATLADQDTCLDAFENATDGAGFRDRLQAALANTTIFSSNSLAIATEFQKLLVKLGLGGGSHTPPAAILAPPPQNRKLLTDELDSEEATPSWATSNPLQRRLLHPSPWSGPVNVTVAQDGSGNFTTITDALNMVPKKSLQPFVIHVKAGKYLEYATVNKSMQTVFLIGDGIDKTIIAGNKNIHSGTLTFRTATFTVEGIRFMARDIAFENTAGPDNDQAVAVRVKADLVVFYKCLFTAFQDTLYVHSYRQFYRDCEIRGTVDFIFGYASAVFQNCTISPRQSLSGKANTITAHAGLDLNQNTGIVVDRCRVRQFGPFGDTVKTKTFLGRPWKNYSTTVFMKSELSSIVDPAGWVSWNVSVEPSSTIYYAEYKNFGPGSDTAGRVNWTGYHPALSESQARRFTVDTFL